MPHGPIPKTRPAIPARAGLGLEPQHLQHILTAEPKVGFFEVHAENYMGAGGPPHRYLTRIRERYPLSLHGVGLSIGGGQPLDRAHLERLAVLIGRYEPGLFSEHLAWSTHDQGFLNDLLPPPYTSKTLLRIVQHIDQVQNTLGRQMLLENPSTYVRYAGSTWAEADFIAEITRRTGCGLLLDVNNVYIACTNQIWDLQRYITDFPLADVQQMHLAGHSRQTDDIGRPLLIDTHDKHVDRFVWDLFRQVIARTGPVPTLIEWDTNVPDWADLHAEALIAEALLDTVRPQDRRHAACG